VDLEGLDPEAITGDDLRLAVGRTLGWQLLKSTLFDVKRSALGYRFTGRGAGHGVGLCVVGSAHMAAEGATASTILSEYFPGTRIERLANEVTSTGDVRLDISLPAVSQGAMGDLQRTVRQMLGDLGRRAGVAPPTQLRLVFHPTVEAYTRQTKLPWWTSAATSGERIDLLPLTILQERQILDRTLRHELAHALTARYLADRPVWVKEGVAISLSGERVDPPAASARRETVQCPIDDEFLRSTSPVALRDAYARASACFAAQIAAGRRWNEVR
jgi:stage II sporulation protein D